MERIENKVPRTTLTLSFLQQKAQATSHFEMNIMIEVKNVRYVNRQF